MTGRSVCAIAVMAKLPQSGCSKTRLCPPLTPDQAASLSAAFLRDTTDNVHAAAAIAPVMAYAAYTPAGSESFLVPYLAPETGLVLADGTAPAPAGVEGFGRCLVQALEGLLARGFAAACLLSSDTPTLPTRVLAEAAQILLEPGERGVFGACDDGGYYLLGLKRAHDHLFRDIAWSTGSVAEITRTRAREIGLDLVELEPWYDVDDAEGLARLTADTAGYAAPRTRAVLARLHPGVDATL
ncbi:TIGR04282 family arsenosugar biosynthesis glycosyltransferase [Methylobacterium persicinum]|uniref:RSAM/selenodomain-associated transferase 1 n=1 Tax=Methylobacterium persicinum TaxID=374426 RepID=A0ABU0HKH0_9HYPH|nr:TIGR04282 family arsenosugar biosynthesis glycosyltransferase [Methylobacterium persicinum]MDQ0442019.1 rSAM/selenodomain-associated transferase 1 [Methylobacterium persicinum]GJE38880.1 Phosphoenolpyruvate guanylyltransferase [Methylobacterium persicinum]